MSFATQTFTANGPRGGDYELLTIPCLTGTYDNYAVLIHDPTTGNTTLVDAPEPGPIQAALDARGWRLTEVILSHHHPDHVQALPELLANVASSARVPRVVGAAADALRLPPLDAEIIDAPGHTIGQVAYHLPTLGVAFTADSLMAMGCGRLFEGTPAQMWDTLQRLRALPDATTIYSGHEYTATNIAYALTLTPEDPALLARAEATRAARDAGKFTVPSPLALEKATNPFLRVDDPAFAAAVGMANASPVEIFTSLRKGRDSF